MKLLTLGPTKTRMDSRSGAPAMLAARANPLTALGSTKSLQRQTTDEALEEEKKRLDKRRELLQVKKQVHEANHQLATVASGSSNTQAPPSSSAQAPPGLTIQSGTPVALQPQHGVFNAILPQKMLAPINIHCEQQTSAFLSTGTSPISGSSATPPVVAMPKQMGAMEQVQEVMQEKLYKLQAIQKQLHDKKTKRGGERKESAGTEAPT